MSILFIPDYRDGNPYQSNLECALREDVTYGRKNSRLPVCRELLSGDVSLVHLHWLSAFFNGGSLGETIKRFGVFLVWLTLIRLRNVPVVWTVHNVRIHDSEHPTAERIFKRWFISNMCERFVVHCAANETEFVDEYGLPASIRDRIDVIPHGHYFDNYENELSRREARNSLDVPDSSTVFLFFGMVCPYKGIDSLIDAFQALSTTDVQLLIAGSPVTESYENELHQRCDDDETIRTDFEYIPDDEVQRYMNAADAVVLPYRDITTSGSAILAMSFGSALIVPAVGCLPELLSEDGAVIYDPSRPDALTSALETATERDLEAMGEFNREEVAEYDWDGIARQTEQTYANVR